MSTDDPQTCRRALREIGEIAAVARLPDTQMTDREALESISAIAEWVDEETSGAQPDCGSIIHRLNTLTADIDFDALTDGEALVLFRTVLDALRRV